MRSARKGMVALVAGISLLLGAPAPAVLAAGAGGVEATVGGTGVSTAPPAGGTSYGSVLANVPRRPRVRALRLSARAVRAGRPASLLVRIARPGARTVRVRVTLVAVRGGRTRHLPGRRLRAGRTVRVALPRTLRPGRYRVRLAALGARGERPVRASGPLLRVLRKPKPRPRRPAAQAPRSTPVTPVPPSLGGSPQASGVFPVRGPYTFGGADSRFGAGRTGHTHEGQDVSAAQGVPIVAPLAGSVLFNAYQRGGAGRYVVLHADNGWDMFFAHCRAGTANVPAGARVNAGQQLCEVGATGDASGPHLHFEIWPDGWRQVKGTRPIDPLPQLRAWAR